MFLIIIVALIYFLGFKKYYLLVKDVSKANQEELIKIMKYELGLRLIKAKAVLEYAPYDLYAGSFLEAITAKRKMQKAGAEVSIFTTFFWQKDHEGARNAAEPEPENKQLENSNEEAWEYLAEAAKKGEIEGDLIYMDLTSIEDAVEVDRLIDKAEEVADDHYELEYQDKVHFFRNAVSFAMKRHWTHSWMIIGGVFLSIIILASFNSDNQGAVREAEHRVSAIEDWEEADTVFKEYPSEIKYFNDYNNPKHAKSDVLCSIYRSHLMQKELVEDYKHRADTTTSDSNKKRFLETAEEHEEKAEELLEKYEEVNEMDFDDFQDYCLEVAEERVDAAEGNAFFVWFLFVTFLLMTPLYIMASYQYGYIINKYQNESSILEKIKKGGFALAASLFGAGLAMQFFPSVKVKTYWSNGTTSTHTEEDPANAIIIALKIGLFIAAALVVCFVSCILMTYQTITGLYRNYDWNAIYNKAKALRK
ncbi:MAG: hypothetical protein IKD40_07200 [Bacteroidaceae bacterium]|nr:hypothetical protein [Bacteroidaceae bacterium]